MPAFEIIILRLLGGVLLIVPYVWSIHVSWCFWFGERRTPPQWPSGWIGFVLFMLMPLMTVGGTMLIMSVCTDFLMEMNLRLPIEFAHFVGVGAAAAIGIPFAMYWWRLRCFRSIMHITSPRCIECRYALRGLNVKRGNLRCPECGCLNSAREVVEQFRMHKRILKNADQNPWWR